MTEFTRLTIVGAHRKAELVIPDDESLGGLIPQLMDLLGESTGSVARPLTLVRSTGEQLDISQSAAEQRINDGELLRLVRQDDAPPPPEVADVTDVLAESHSERHGLWHAKSREATGAVALGALGFAVASFLNRVSLESPAVVAIIAIAVLVVTALVLGRVGFRWGAIALTAVAIGAILPSTTLALAAVEIPDAALGAATAVIAIGIGWIAIGAGIGVGVGHRSARWGSLVGTALALVPLAILLTGGSVLGAVTITAVVAVVACGLLPWYAMSASGLTGLDDQVVEGRLKRRDEVVVTVTSAYRTLTWATAATAIPLGVTGALLLSSSNPWAVGLGVAVVAVTALRTRAFPLAAQGFALWAAAVASVVVGVSLQAGLDELATVAILGAIAVGFVVGVAVRPAAHQRASLRRLGNSIEALCVVALFPLTLGVFGIYADLLAAF